MLFPSPRRASKRAPRARFWENTPAVLRSTCGFTRGKLQVVSLTGGLLTVPRPLDRGTRVKLMFLTPKGSVFGAAEMLPEISWTQQPFKFTRLYDDDEQRLQSTIQSSLSQSRYRHVEVERFRAW